MALAPEDRRKVFRDNLILSIASTQVAGEPQNQSKINGGSSEWRAALRQRHQAYGVRVPWTSTGWREAPAFEAQKLTAIAWWTPAETARRNSGGLPWGMEMRTRGIGLGLIGIGGVLLLVMD